MNIRRHPQKMRAALMGVALAAGVGLLTGCESYERAPLDLTSHRAAVGLRLELTEPLSAFAQRLADSGSPAPDRFDPTDGLTSAEGEVLALFYNPDLRLARLDADIALVTFETAGLWEDPEFGFDGAEILSPAGVFEYGLTLSVTIPVSGRLEVEKDRAGAAYEAELRRIVDAEWTTRAAVRRAWAGWSIATERLGLLAEVVAQVERIESITGRLEEAGELTRVEGRLLRVELAGRRAELVGARLAARRAEVVLLGLMGLAPDSEVSLIPSPPTPVVVGYDDPVQRLIEANTALGFRRAEYRTAEQTLRLAVREQYPDITIGGGYGSEDDDRLLLGVSIPIPVFNANRASIAEARARREHARAAAETTFDGLRRELALARAGFDAARSQLRTYETEIVPMLDEQNDDVESLIELGEVDTLLLLETVTRRFEAKIRLLDLRLDELNAATKLVRLLGPDEPGGPSPVRTIEDTTRREGDAAAPQEGEAR